MPAAAPARAATPSPLETSAEAALTIVLMGAVPIIIRHITANPWTIGIARLTIATGGLLAVIRATRRWQRLPLSDWGALAVIGALFGAHWVLYFFSIKVASASMAVIGQSTFGVHLVVLGWVIGHHHVRRVDLYAVGLAVGGSLLVAPRWSLADRDTLGLLLGIASAFFYSFLPILHQRLAHVSSAMRVLGQFLFGLVVFAAFLPQADWRLTHAEWGWLAVLGVVCTLVQHTLWTRLTTRLSTLTTSVLFYMAVPVTLVFSVLLLHERITGWMVAGAGLIVSGNLLSVLAGFRNPSRNAMAAVQST